MLKTKISPPEFKEYHYFIIGPPELFNNPSKINIIIHQFSNCVPNII